MFSRACILYRRAGSPWSDKQGSSGLASALRVVLLHLYLLLTATAVALQMHRLTDLPSGCAATSGSQQCHQVMQLLKAVMTGHGRPHSDAAMMGSSASRRPGPRLSGCLPCCTRKMSHTAVSLVVQDLAGRQVCPVPVMLICNHLKTGCLQKGNNPCQCQRRHHLSIG